MTDLVEPALRLRPVGQYDFGTAAAVVVRYGRSTSGGGIGEVLYEAPTQGWSAARPLRGTARTLGSPRPSPPARCRRAVGRRDPGGVVLDNGATVEVLAPSAGGRRWLRGVGGSSVIFREHVPADARRSYLVTRKAAILCHSMSCPW
ncbi:hypothetical protein [Streptomyces sp. NPDC055140]